jgi:ABC-type transport system involved in multi-copper enzyme maturation permease subunit
MSFFTIAERELLVAAKRASTYRTRALAAGATTAVGAVLLFIHVLAAPRTSFGSSLFLAVSNLLLALCLLTGLGHTSDCISSERREGTLGLLFLANLGGWEIVFGKLLATSLRTFYTLLGTFPLLALTLPLGGVTFGEVCRVGLALMSLLLLFAAVGLMVSSLSEDQSKPFTAALVVLAAMFLAPLGLAAGLSGLGALALAGKITVLSPLTCYLRAFDLAYQIHADRYWASLVITQVLVCACLAVAVWRVSRAREGGSAVPLRTLVKRRRFAPRRSSRSAWGQRALDESPLYWLFGACSPGRPWLWTGVTAFLLIVGLSPLVRPQNVPFWQGLAYFVFILWSWPVKIAFTADVCRHFAEVRQNAMLDLVLGTAMREKDILRGHYLAIRQAWAIPVASVVLAVLGFGLATAFMGGARAAVFTMGLPGPLGAIFLLADFVALYYVGAWFGLGGRRPNQATILTLVLVQVVPSVLCCGLRVVSDLAFFLWACRKLRSEFRAAAQKPPKDTII